MVSKSVLSLVGGVYDAANFAYGLRQGSSAAVITAGNEATGAGTSITVGGQVSLADGSNINPFSTDAPIRILDAGQSETVTPTGVAQNSDGSITITGDFTKTHGRGALVASGTGGLQEALDYAQANGGGVVVVDQGWVRAGGTQAILLAASVGSGCSIKDMRGASGAGQVLSGNADAINPTAGNVVIDTAGVNNTTLAAPTAGTNDMLRLRVVSATADAHTITTPANGINGSKHVATFGGAVGDAIELVAYNGTWLAESLNGVTLV